nr:MAG TPA: tail tape measure protein [Caudoviricetes sp.]
MLAQAEAQLRATTTALKAANNGMDGFASSTEKASSKSLAGAIAQGTVMAGIFSKLYAAALSAAEGFISSGIEYNAQIEKYTTGFTNMLGSAEAANEAMKAIQEDAARTPFDVASLTEANQLLISAGENAGYSRKVIMALGDAVSATGGGNVELSRMAGNLQQIANVGKATAVDIKQFAYAGINIYQVLADYTGKSVQDVQNMTVSYDLLSEALIAASEEGGRYYNAMDAQSQTMNGRVSTLKDNVSQLAGLMTGDLSSGIGIVISNLNDMTVAAIDAYKTDGWKGLGEAILDLDNPISAIVKKFGELGSAAVNALSRASYALNKALGKTAYADYDSYEEYEGDRLKQKNRDRLRRDAQSGKSVSNESWTERQAKLAAAAGSGESSITTSPAGTTKKATTKHVAADTKKLADSIKETSQEILAGTGNIVGSIQRVTETADNTYNVYDGTTKQLKGTTKETVQTITDSWTEVVDGTEKTIKKITKNVTDAAGKVTTTTTQTCDKVVLSVSEMQKRIDKQLSEAQSKWQSGIMGTLQSVLTDLKNGNWTSLATDFAKLIWGEVTQEQRKIISDWCNDAMDVINESYSGGGMKKAFETLQQLLTKGFASGEGGSKATIDSLSNLLLGTGGKTSQLLEVKSNVDSITLSVDAFKTSLESINAGGIMSNLSGIAGGFGGITQALSGIVGFIVSNPVVAVILGLTALVGGAALSAWSKNRDEKLTNNYESPFSKTPVYDSLAEFSYRADQFNRYKGLTASPFSSGQQDTTGRQQLSVLQRISNSLDEHLPAIGTGTLVIDANGVQALAGAMQPTLVDGIDGDLGIRSTRKARGG